MPPHRKIPTLTVGAGIGLRGPFVRRSYRFVNLTKIIDGKELHAE